MSEHCRSAAQESASLLDPDEDEIDYDHTEDSLDEEQSRLRNGHMYVSY